VVSPNDFVLKLLDLLAVELDKRAAPCADQMIVMIVFVLVLVKHSAVVKLELASETAVLEQLESAIDSGEPDRRVFGLDYGVQVFAGDVPFCIQEHIEYQVALAGSFQAGLFEMFLKDLFFFAFHKGKAGVVRIIHSCAELTKLMGNDVCRPKDVVQAVSYR